MQTKSEKIKCSGKQINIIEYVFVDDIVIMVNIENIIQNNFNILNAILNSHEMKINTKLQCYVDGE